MRKYPGTWFILAILIVLIANLTACKPREATPSPTASPAVSDPSGRLFIVSDFAYVDLIDFYHIVGEVENRSDDYMRFVNIAATLYDAEGQVIGAESMYTFIDIIPPGTKTPFNVSFFDQPVPASYKLQIEGYDSDSRPLTNLEILSHSMVDKGEGLFLILGEVKNGRSIPAKFVKVIATLYDKNNKLVGTEFTYVELSEIPAGGTSAFSIGIYTGVPFDHYELTVVE
jgi:hypothetical protein